MIGENHTFCAEFDAVSDHAEFIPEMWSQDVLAAYKQNLVLAGLANQQQSQLRQQHAQQVGQAVAQQMDRRITNQFRMTTNYRLQVRKPEQSVLGGIIGGAASIFA